MKITKTTQIEVNLDDFQSFLVEKGIIPKGQNVSNTKYNTGKQILTLTCTEVEEKQAEEENTVKLSSDEMEKILKSRIFEFDLSTRIIGMLRAAEVETVEELINIPEKKLYLFRNLGKKSVSEIKIFLKRYGLKLKEEK